MSIQQMAQRWEGDRPSIPIPWGGRTEPGQDLSYNLSEAGGAGFGVKDINLLRERGYSSKDIVAIANNARRTGKNIGTGARDYLSQAPYDAEGNPRQFDYGSFGGEGMGREDIREMVRRGWDTYDIDQAATTADQLGLNVGRGAREWLGRSTKPAPKPQTHDMVVETPFGPRATDDGIHGRDTPGTVWEKTPGGWLHRGGRIENPDERRERLGALPPPVVHEDTFGFDKGGPDREVVGTTDPKPLPPGLIPEPKQRFAGEPIQAPPFPPTGGPTPGQQRPEITVTGGPTPGVPLATEPRIAGRALGAPIQSPPPATALAASALAKTSPEVFYGEDSASQYYNQVLAPTSDGLVLPPDAPGVEVFPEEQIPDPTIGRPISDGTPGVPTATGPRPPISDGTPGVTTATGPRPPRSDGTPGFDKRGPGRRVVAALDPKPLPPGITPQQKPSEDGYTRTTPPSISNPMRFAGNMPLTGYVGSHKGSRGNRLGRGNTEMGSPVWGGGFGGGNVSNINIEANPIQSNILTQGPTTTSAAGRDTGAISVDNPQTPTVDTSTTGEIGPGTETPATRQAPAAHDVAYRSDYTGDLTSQQAAGKANQLLSRALGQQGVTNQAEYNKYFEPLYEDLQKGGDYGHDISRFYGEIEKGGRTPYQDFAGPLGKGTYGDFMGGINTREAMGGFYDPADLGRRALEAKALYRPGGEGTNLDKVGQLQQQWEAYDTEPFYGKSRGYGKDAGYRAGGTAWTGGQGRDAWKQYYEAYLAGA